MAALLAWPAYAAGTIVPAMAADECGSGASVTCTSAGNPFAGGITYSASNQTVTLQSGVVVTAPNGGLGLNGSGTQTVNIASGVSIGTSAAGADGVYFYGAPSAVVIRAAGSAVSTANSNTWGYNVGDAAGVPGSVDAIVGDVTVGNVSGASTNVRGVYARSTGGSVSLTTGTVIARGTGDGVYGVYGLSSSSDVAVHTGQVTLSGGGTAFGIYAASGGGNVSVTTGGVSNSGSGGIAGGILAATSGSGTVLIDSTGGAVTLSGGTSYSTAVSASGAAAVTVKTASVSTAASATSAISVMSQATGTARTIVDTSAGTISTTGTGAATGISVQNTAAANAADISITTGAVSTKGTSAYGISTTSKGAVFITAGDITTLGGGADAIRISGAGAITIGAQDHTISTSGNGADGIRIDRTSANPVTINAGTITTGGIYSEGIHVFNGTYNGVSTPDGGAISITAQSVSTSGTPDGSSNAANAISAYTSGAGANGRIDIDTSAGAAPGTLGLVKTTGDKARGIWAQSGWIASPSVPTGGGAITIKAGDVATEGESAEGIHAATSGVGADGAVTVTVLGTVSTKGAGPSGTNGGPATGIDVVSWGGGPVSITAHDIATLGDNAGGIFAQTTNGGTLDIDTRGGTVSTRGGAAAGITATFGSGGSTAAMTVRTGNVTTEGSYSNAVNAFAGGANASILVDTTGGSIVTRGSSASGVNVNGNVTGSTATAGLVTVRVGNVRTEGTGTAVSVQAGTGGMDVTVAGAASTVGVNSWGVSLTNKLSGTSKLAVNGSITTTGDTGHGVVAGFGGGTGTSIITVAGSISATGDNAIGIMTTGRGDSVSVAAGGLIRGHSAGVQFQETDTSPTSLTNAGTITGDAGPAVTFLGASPSTFTNTGTVNGDVKLGGGADLAILGTGSVINGILNGGSGSDTVRFTGDGNNSFDAATAINFEVAQKTGAGTWTLTGSSTTLPDIDVQQGRLAVDGTLASLTATIDGGAVLGGHGTLGSFSALAGAIVAPGNSIGTLTVGSASFAAGSVLEAELDASGSADLLQVTGIADIAAAASVHTIPGPGTYTVGQEFLVLDAGTRNGSFTGLSSDSAFLRFELDQAKSLRQVWLRLTAIADLPSVAQTPNQRATAEGLQSLGGSDPLVNAIVPLSAAAARGAFDQLSGEIHASLTRALIDASRAPREAVFDRIDAAFSAIDGSRAEHARTLWTRSYGSLGTVVGDGNAASFSTASGGLMVGADGLIGDNGFAGVLAGMSLSHLSAPDRSSSADIASYQLGVYGGTRLGQVTVKVGAAGSLDQATVTRTPAVTGLGQTLTSSQLGVTGQLFGELAYAFPLDKGSIEPFARLAVVTGSAGAYAESGGPAALDGHANAATAVIATLGVRAATDFVLGDDMVVHAHAMLGVQQRFGGAPTATQAFAGGAPFTVAGPSGGATSVVVEAGASTTLGRGVDLDVYYSGQMSTAGQSHALKATLSGRF
ncbi:MULTISPECIES: autotransporter domain-containing protein [unclassified Devosia]|uniref:autotransporter domain-containing protein n=1 Tax=unclassified Devosia TaxID=196773 RepID=UPI001ACF4FBD|nr:MULTISPECIES: autotransporter domain-containing protein [unclassified Devosia]MBN9306625.1 autotransporter domain-containing protein [Devosia sp.]